MVAAREAHEYVHVKDFSIVQAHLRHASDQLQKGAGDAFDARELHEQRTAELEKARALLNEILRDSDELNRLFMKDAFKCRFKKERPQKPRARAAAKPKIREEEFVEKSQKALENLQKNIQELKKQLEF